MKKNYIYFLILTVVAAFISSCNSKQQQDYSYPTSAESIPDNSKSSSFEALSNANLNDTVTLESGLKIILIKRGNGNVPASGKKVKVHYTGYLENGNKFDSSVDRNSPIEFSIGKGEVIKGWDEGIALLESGTIARLIIPSGLAYGAEGYENLIPPGATLIFDVELIYAE